VKLFSVRLEQGDDEVVVAVMAESAHAAEARARAMLSGARGKAHVREWPDGAFAVLTTPTLRQKP